MRGSGFSIFLVAMSFASGSDRANAAEIAHSFDGPDLAWQLAAGPPTAKVLSHGLARDEVREGTGSERLTVAVPGGETVHFVFPIDRLPALDELEVRMWLKSTNPGTKLAARFVLPRSIDTKTGVPKSVLVTGDECKSPDRWQQLRIADVPRALASQVRVLRAARREVIDPREAYADAFVLIVPGGETNTTVWTDALEVDGAVLASATTKKGDAAVVQTVFSPPSWPQAAAPTSAAGNTPTTTSSSVQFRGTTLLLSDRPFLPRGIEWNHEPLAFLAARGFNTIWLDEPPTPELSAEAARANLWLICMPPSPDRLSETGLGKALDRVLAWNLGSPNGPQELDYYRRWANQVRDLDVGATRPILLTPRGDWLPASQIADALMAKHPATASLVAAEYSEWLRQLPFLARPGTPIWTVVPTQPDPRVRAQTAALAPNASRIPGSIDDAQFEALVTAALTNGCRGFLFRSDSPLDAPEPAARRRAAMLEQWNDRLDLIEPWLTIGKQVGEATSTDASTVGVVLQAERARLLVPIATGPPKVDASTSVAKIAFVVPGIPVSNESYLLSPAGFSALTSTRIAGGTRIEIPREFDGYVLMTEDQAAITGFRQRVAKGSRRAAQVQYGLAASRSRSLAQASAQLHHSGITMKQLDQAVGEADAELKTAGASLTAGNFDAAYRQASRALRALNRAAAETSQSVKAGPTFDSMPFVDEPASWGLGAEFTHSLASLHSSENQLIGGDFEDLQQVRRAGWQHVEDPIAGVDTKVELSGNTPREGRYSLQLVARAKSPEQAPQIVARAPVWITSPPLRAAEDEVLEISGWVRINEPIQGNIDGLEIVDSLGGRELALRIRQTDGWQPFRLIRGTRETTNVTLTFALHGLGTASIDGVMVRSLAAPKVKRLPTIPPGAGSAFPNSAARTLFPTSGRR